MMFTVTVTIEQTGYPVIVTARKPTVHGKNEGLVTVSDGLLRGTRAFIYPTVAYCEIKKPSPRECVND